MRQCAIVLIAAGALLVPAKSTAKTSERDRERIAASLQEVSHFRGVRTDVVVNGCEVEITSVLRQTCLFGAVKSSQTRVDLSEVEEITLSPFRDIFTIHVKLFVPGRSPLKFFFDRLTLGEDEHFRQFSEAREQAIRDANLQSGTVLRTCDGDVSSDPSQSFLTLFLDKEPSEWAALQQLVNECKKP